MAPSRRKGAGKAAAAAAAARQWKVGDLVLAKVKGFPAWPATVSEPEKWGYSADLKKVMVHFFGTEQIAFCNPGDVQAFTEEKKQSLLTKRHGKGSDFVRAVKEIIESYEKLKKQEEADDQKSANDTTPECGRSSAESLQVRENQPVASLDTQFDLDISKGGDTHKLFSEDASAAEQMLALSGNNTSLERPDDSLALKEAPKIATYFSRKKRSGTRSQKFSQLKAAPSLQQSKSSSRVDVSRYESSTCVGDLGLDGMDGGAGRRRKRIRRSIGTSGSDDVGLLALNSNGTDDEDASEIATVESDNSIPNGGSGVDSISKSEDSTKVVDLLEGEPELNKGCGVQIKAILKKKRKPTRKRGSSDAADPPTKVDVVADIDTGTSTTCHSSQNSYEDLSERPSKETGDEHLPLVKRARVRMSRTYTDDEVNTSSQIEERLSTDIATNELSEAMPSLNHDKEAFSNCQSHVEKEPMQICMEVSAKIPGDVANVVLVEQRSFDNTSPSKVTGDRFSNSQHDELIEPEPLSQQFNSILNGEFGLPSSKHCVVGATLATVVEDVQACSGASSTMNVLINESDMPATEGSHGTSNTLTCLQHCGVDSFANNASWPSAGLNLSISEEPAKSSAVDESRKHSPSGDNMVRSADFLSDKSQQDDACTVQTVVQFIPRGESPSVLSPASMLERSEADDYQLRERPGSPNKDGYTSSQIIENPVQDESDVLFQNGDSEAVGNSKCMAAEPLKPEDGGNSQQNVICEVVEVRKDQVQAANSVSVNDNHSCEKMSVPPADLSGSPVRPTLHSSLASLISTAESANILQSNGGCTPKDRFHERRNPSDDVPEAGERMETGESQKPKFVSISSNYAEAHASLLSFEGALGSLVRTKESIARATRLAMDCAKLGVSAKVMENIANNLENESDLQRRVDSFFLVDSIAQCSRNLKGDAGDLYLSSIQSMLPRLLFAAAPPGATTQENRRQCLKVLRLWLERRILPDYVLCHHIRDLDSHCSELSACLYSRRSARTERALDDPVRDMEGMLVDEYGSNSTLQLPGLSIPSLLKDEDEGSDSDGGDFEAVTPEHDSGIPAEQQEQLVTSATERHTHVLEDVDGELEMEDVAPSCDIAVGACKDFAPDGTQQTSQNQLGQDSTFLDGPLSQDASSSLPPFPPSPHPHTQQSPPHSTQCAMSASYSSGFDNRGHPDMHGDNLGSASRMNPPMSTNTMHYQGPDTSSYSNSRSRPTNNLQHNEGSNFQPRLHPPCPPCHPPPPPPPPHHFSHMAPPSHHTKSRRDMPPYSQRSSHYMPDYDERHFHDNHERMRPRPYESRENWRHPPDSYGPRYHDKPKGPYGQGSYGGPPREPPRFHDQRWNPPPRPFNHQRNSFHHKPHPEGPVPVGMRDPGMWHQR